MRTRVAPWEVRRAGEGEGEGTSPGPGAAAPPEPLGWLPAEVPGTALGALVRAGALPDPYLGANLPRVPDVFHAGRAFYTFDWRAAFPLPALPPRRPPPPRRRRAPPPGRASSCLPACCLRPRRGAEDGDGDDNGDDDGGGPKEEWTRAWLHVGGANYTLEGVAVNGVAVEVEEPKGMFLRRSLDVTHAAAWGTANEVLLRMAPPDHVGCVDRGGQGGDHHIAKDVTAQYVAGWDWTVPVPDRNTGLWDHVEVEVRLVGCLFAGKGCRKA